MTSGNSLTIASHCMARFGVDRRQINCKLSLLTDAIDVLTIIIVFTLYLFFVLSNYVLKTLIGVKLDKCLITT